MWPIPSCRSSPVPRIKDSPVAPNPVRATESSSRTIAYAEDAPAPVLSGRTSRCNRPSHRMSSVAATGNPFKRVADSPSPSSHTHQAPHAASPPTGISQQVNTLCTASARPQNMLAVPVSGASEQVLPSVRTSSARGLRPHAGCMDRRNHLALHQLAFKHQGLHHCESPNVRLLAVVPAMSRLEVHAGP
jgi:hypothetical protein